ncbi:hypothetical protein BpHYR1_004263 [Brachionus plicatilis]|uniref:Uncharacterized protein n=1 Tax=Brachionus plicatilis TaxID=10195 RepID=A0A3M7SVP4_BRAPC|nr:hypothetical protein BpHYR1_004263 [Brachionus plicatilis]
MYRSGTGRKYYSENYLIELTVRLSAAVCIIDYTTVQFDKWISVIKIEFTLQNVEKTLLKIDSIWSHVWVEFCRNVKCGIPLDNSWLTLFQLSLCSYFQDN